jgi:peptidoglycan/xylan/chitin deacetylase (PgdA/CDA1 family)
MRCLSHPLFLLHSSYSSRNTFTTCRARLDLALVRILGVTSAFMRPPYGAYNDNVRAVAASRGQKVAMWDFDSGDSLGRTPAQSNQDYTDLANRRPPTINALNHEVFGNCLFRYPSASWIILMTD